MNINISDIESSWAGVRPLIQEEGKNPSDISRKDEIWKSDSGLITIAGGKLTGYRKMAETVVDLLAEQLYAEEKVKYPGGQTGVLPISGGLENYHRYTLQAVCALDSFLSFQR